MEMGEYIDLQSDEWEIDDTLLETASVRNPDGSQFALKESFVAPLNVVTTTSFTKISLVDLDKNQHTSRKLPYTRIDK